MRRVRLGAVLSVLIAAALAGPVPAAEQPALQGQIKEVRPSDHQVVVTTRDGKEVVFQVDDRSNLRRQGQKATLDQFSKGMEVAVTYREKDGKKCVVSLTNAAALAQDVQQQIQNTLQTVKSFSFQQKDEYSQKLQGLLGQIDARIGQLKEQASRAGADAREKLNKEIANLQQMRSRVETTLEKVKSATPEAWEDVKSGVSNALKDLGNAFGKALEHFR